MRASASTSAVRDTLKDDAGNATGNHVRVKVVKNKVAPPFVEAEFDIIYNHGINKEGCILEVGIADGVVDKKGAWLQFEGELIGQGKEAAQKALIEKPALAKKNCGSHSRQTRIGGCHGISSRFCKFTFKRGKRAIFDNLNS
ncbi:MAG: hypothetical protein WDM76_13645 [Limisphaerales bacterium]